MQEAQYAAELADWDRKIGHHIDDLVVLTRDNTQALTTVSELTRSQKQLEAGLATTSKTMFSDPIEQRKKEVSRHKPW
jgi:hypothetical protein